MDKVYCLHCHDFMTYNVDLEPVGIGLPDSPPPFNELVARCVACRHEVYVPMVHDQNIMERMRRSEEARHEST